MIAVADEDGAHQLHAYVVLAAETDVATLRQSLASQVPDALLPSHWTVLDSLPLTANGKLDRRALPTVEAALTTREGPQGPTEQALAQLWCDLLGRSDIPRSASFTELGGDSLLSLKLLARIRKQGLQGERKLTLADVLNASSLAVLAECLTPPPVAEPEVVFLSRSGSGVPLFCLPGLIVNSSEFKPLVAALGEDRPVYGFVSHVYTEQRWRGYDVLALASEYAEYIVRTVKGAAAPCSAGHPEANWRWKPHACCKGAPRSSSSALWTCSSRCPFIHVSHWTLPPGIARNRCWSTGWRARPWRRNGAGCSR